MTALGKSLTEEFGPQGVRVTTVSPGPVRTAFWDASRIAGLNVTVAACLTGQALNIGYGPVSSP